MNPNPFNFKLAKWGILTGVINMNVIGLMFRFPTESIFDWGHTLIAFLPGIILGVTLLCAGLPIDRRTKISFNRKLGFVAFASASFNIAFHTGWAIMGAKVFSEELHGDIHGYLPTFFGITFGMAMAGLIGAIVLLIGFHLFINKMATEDIIRGLLLGFWVGALLGFTFSYIIFFPFLLFLTPPFWEYALVGAMFANIEPKPVEIK